MTALIALILLAHFHLLGLVILLGLGALAVCALSSAISVLLSRLGGWLIVIGFALLTVSIFGALRPEEIIPAIGFMAPFAAFIGFILWTTRRPASPAQEPPAS